MPSCSPAALNCRVTCRSSADGSGLPDGWLWTRMRAAARSTTASRKTSRGWTSEASRMPLVICRWQMGAFWELRRRTWNSSWARWASAGAKMWWTSAGPVMAWRQRAPGGPHPAAQLDSGHDPGRHRQPDAGDGHELAEIHPGELLKAASGEVQDALGEERRRAASGCPRPPGAPEAPARRADPDRSAAAARAGAPRGGCSLTAVARSTSCTCGRFRRDRARCVRAPCRR